MRPVYITTIVFNRHDCLANLFRSCAKSNRRPDGVYVVDHGYDESKVYALEPELDGIPLTVVTIEDPGCALAANWFLKNVPEDRIGCGDDVEFEPDAIGIMADTPGEFVIPEPTLNPAACCAIRDSCVQRIGYFDEKISPQYLYFDDTDFLRRLGLAGGRQTVAKGAFVKHVGNASLSRLTPAQHQEHVRRFNIAHENYLKKWGGEPFYEKFETPRDL